MQQLIPNYPEQSNDLKKELAASTSGQIPCHSDLIGLLYSTYKKAIMHHNNTQELNYPFVIGEVCVTSDRRYYSKITYAGTDIYALEELYVEFFHENGFGYGICAGSTGTTIGSFGTVMNSVASKSMARLVMEFKKLRSKRNSKIIKNSIPILFAPKDTTVVYLPEIHDIDELITIPLRFHCNKQLIEVFKFALCQAFAIRITDDYIHINISGDITENTMVIVCTMVSNSHQFTLNTQFNTYDMCINIECLKIFKFNDYENFDTCTKMISNHVYDTALKVFNCPEKKKISMVSQKDKYNSSADIVIKQLNYYSVTKALAIASVQQRVVNTVISPVIAPVVTINISNLSASAAEFTPIQKNIQQQMPVPPLGYFYGTQNKKLVLYQCPPPVRHNHYITHDSRYTLPYFTKK